MRRIGTGVCIFILVIVAVVCVLANNKEEDVSVIIKSFTENGSYVEYPQIKGLGDRKKQERINALLEEQVYKGAKTYEYEPFVDFSNPEYVYTFETGVGLKSSDIISFWYSFYASGEVVDKDGGVWRDTSRLYGVTVDMKTGEKIELSDFMQVDGRLIQSTDGSNEETDFNSAVQPSFHKFRDLFMIYTSEEGKDAYHIFSPREIINILTNPGGESLWYIDGHKQIVFIWDDNSIRIPYSEIAETIYPQYLESLNTAPFQIDNKSEKKNEDGRESVDTSKEAYAYLKKSLCKKIVTGVISGNLILISRTIP